MITPFSLAVKMGKYSVNSRQQPLYRALRSLCFSVILPVVSRPVLAGGLYLNEFGTPAMGTAGAGAQALANDASTAFHNAAGMTRLEGEEVMVTGGLLYADLKFDPDPNTPDSGRRWRKRRRSRPHSGGVLLPQSVRRLEVRVERDIHIGGDYRL